MKSSRLLLLLTGPLLILLGACGRKLPRAEIAKQIDALYPHTHSLGLTLEIKAEEKGDLLLIWKDRRRIDRPTYRPCPDVTGDDGMAYERSHVEYERAGLCTRSTEANLLFDARYEPAAGIVLLEPVDAVGQEFEIDGLVEARRLIDRWEISALESRTQRAGKTLAQFGIRSADEEMRGRLFGERPPTRYLVLGSKEWDEHLAELRRAREARLALIAQQEAPLLAAVSAGQEYGFIYSLSMGNNVAVRLTFLPGKTESEGHIRLFAPAKPEFDRTLRFDRRPVRVRPEYKNYPTMAIGLEASSLTVNPSGWGQGLFREPDLSLRFRLQDGRLVLDYHRDYVLQRERIMESSAGGSAPGASASAAGPSPAPRAAPTPTPAARSDGPPQRPGAASRALTERAHAIFQGRANGTRSEAVELYAEAARAGDADAAVNLGHIYRAGRLVPRDLERARKLYEQAAAAGNVEAAQALAGMK